MGYQAAPREGHLTAFENCSIYQDEIEVDVIYESRISKNKL